MSDERTLSDLLSDRRVVAMVTTMVGRSHSSRPVVCVDATDARLSFVVDRHAPWVADVLGEQALLHVTVTDERHATYLSLEGHGDVSLEPDEVERLWEPALRAWFDGPDDPDAVVLHFDVVDGEYWLGDQSSGPGESGRVSRPQPRGE